MVTDSDSATLSCPSSSTGEPPLYGRETIAVNEDPGAFVTFDTHLLSNCTELYNSRLTVNPDKKAQLRITTGTAFCDKPNGKTVIIEAGSQHVKIKADPVFGVRVGPAGTVTVKVPVGSGGAEVQSGTSQPVQVAPGNQLAIPPGTLPKQTSVKPITLTPAEFLTVTCLSQGVIPASVQQAGQWLQNQGQSKVLAISQPSPSSAYQKPSGTNLLGTLKSIDPSLHGNALNTTQPSANQITNALHAAQTVVVTGDINSAASTLAKVRSTLGPDVSVLFVPAVPTITGISPTAGPTGTAVTISGANLSGLVSVSFNGVPGQVTGSTSTSITAVVPGAATTGTVTVVTTAGTATTSFIVGVPPAITSVAPTTAKAGASVTITGTHFSGVSSVAFGGVSAAITASSDTSITVVVPTGALVGTSTLTVTTPTGTAMSTFTVTA
jgi:hypothetical protein